VLPIVERAVATSGDYRNWFEVDGKRYSHAIDPRSGSPVSHELAAVTVVARTALVADAYATALLVLGPKDGPAMAEKLGLAALFQGVAGAQAETPACSREITAGTNPNRKERLPAANSSRLNRSAFQSRLTAAPTALQRLLRLFAVFAKARPAHQ
jgi:hypothetical protein